MGYTTENDKQTRQKKFIDTDNSIVVTRREVGSGEVYKSKWGQIYGNERRFDFG